MNWPFFLLLFVLWVIAGRLIFYFYKLYIDKKYPPKEFNAGFFVYLVGRCSDAEKLSEYIARWYINAVMAIKNKLLVKILDYIFWPASLTPLIIYKEFAENKKTAK